MSQALDEFQDELFGLPLDEFVAQRDARAKELRASGDREAADAVKKLRKPTVSAWAVNQLARRERDTLDTLLAAGEALRRAQSALGEGGGDARVLRDAARDERGAIDDLVAAASELLPSASESVLEEVRETLHAAAIDDEARELIDRGRLTKPRRAVGVGGLEAFATAGGGGSPAAGRGKSRAAKPKDDSRRKERVAAAREALRAAEGEARDRRRELERAQRELETAEAEVERKQRALKKAESS